MVAAGMPVLALIAVLRGRRSGSKLARAMADGAYNRAFAPNRTDFDWLSTDKAEVDAYCADPLCGMLCSSGFYSDLAAGLWRIHRRRAIENIRKDLPLYIFCGGRDPVGDMGKSPAVLARLYRRAGIRDVQLVLYPEARHETFNDVCRDEAVSALLSWILKKTGTQNAAGTED